MRPSLVSWGEGAVGWATAGCVGCAATWLNPGAMAVWVIVTRINNLVSVGVVKGSFLSGFVDGVIPRTPSMGLHLVYVSVCATLCPFLEGPDDSLEGVPMLAFCEGVR